MTLTAEKTIWQQITVDGGVAAGGDRPRLEELLFRLRPQPKPNTETESDCLLIVCFLLITSNLLHDSNSSRDTMAANIS